MRKTRQRKLRQQFFNTFGRNPNKMTFHSVSGDMEKVAYVPSEWRRLKKAANK